MRKKKSPMDNQTLLLLFPELRIQKVRLKYVSPWFMVKMQRSLSWATVGDLPLSDNEKKFVDVLFYEQDRYLDLSMSS